MTSDPRGHVASALTYEEALAFWYGCINYEQRTPRPDDLKLEEMRRLLRLLDDPQDQLRIVHVTGSKGKGSTSAMLASILRKAGYRTGLFTSPHLTHVEERIQTDGTPISRQELTTVLSDIRAIVLEHDLSPTFFEVATAAGLLHFLRRRVNVVILEVGLGGRLDSTNICQPEVAVITSVSIDHTRQLGATLARIAFEKAGIIKPRRPVVSGVVTAEAREVIEQIAGERCAPLHEVERDFHFSYTPGHVLPHGMTCDHDYPRLRLMTRDCTWPEMSLALYGRHQASNAAVAVACVEQLCKRGWHISGKAVRDGLASVRWPARLESFPGFPLTILDCAHNVASAQAFRDTLLESFPACPRHLLFASSNDKDVSGILQVLSPHFVRASMTRYRDNPRSVPPEELARIWKSTGGQHVSEHATSEDALRMLQSTTPPRSSGLHYGVRVPGRRSKAAPRPRSELSKSRRARLQNPAT